MDPLAGPSRPRPASVATNGPPAHFFPRPFRIDNYPKPPPTSSSSRCSTPTFTSRHRSSSVFSSSSYAERRKMEKLAKDRYDNVLRLKSTWDSLFDKYASIRAEDDDEVDLRTGKITRDRGKLRELEARDFGDLGYGRRDEDLESEDVLFDSDEDELGAWDDRSGLDEQFGEMEELKRNNHWTWEDEEDLASFMRAEAAIKEQRGDSSGEEAESRHNSEPGSDSDEDGHTTIDTARSWNSRRGTSIAPDLSDLFLEDPANVSEDELDELQAGFGDDEASFVAAVPEIAHSIQTPMRKIRQPSKVPVVEIDTRIRARRHSLLKDFDTLLGSSDEDDLTGPIGSDFESSIADHEPVATSSKVRLDSSPPSLADLFTPPPTSPTMDPCTPHIKINPVIPQSSLHSKGKLRMTNERPTSTLINEPLPPHALSSHRAKYLSTIQRTRHGSIRKCAICLHLDDDKASLAMYCKGRVNRKWCQFYVEPSNENDVGYQSMPSREDLESTAAIYRSPRRSMITALDNSESSEDENQSVRAFSATLRASSIARQPRHCKYCQIAGGNRAAKSSKCRGRIRKKFCTYEKQSIAVLGLETTSAAEEEHSSSSSDASENGENTIRRSDPGILPQGRANAFDGSQSRRRSISRQYSSTPISPILYRNNGTYTRRCSHCKAAGGDREEESYTCPGRASGDRCRYYRNLSRMPSASLTSDRHMTPAHSIRSITTSPAVASDPEVETEAEDGYYPDISFCRGGKYLRTCKACRAAGGERAQKAAWCKGRRKRNMCSFYDESGDHAEWTEEPDDLPRGASMFADAANPRTPRTRRGTQQLDKDARHALLGSGKRKRSLTDLYVAEFAPLSISHTPVSSSMPPSSPPLHSSPLPWQHLARRTSALTSSRSYLARNTPVSQSSQPPSSPSLPRPASDARSRTAMPLQPTPPLSNDWRSASLSSDRTPSSAGRKSILRQPSISSQVPSSASAKKARFSLAPRSPSSDPIICAPGVNDEDEHDEDELLLMSSSANYSSRFSSSYNSSPFSKEMAVRAADAGINLGPGHTGRLPASLISALSSKSPRRTPIKAPATLGSSVSSPLSNLNLVAASSSSLTHTSTFLPTPPRSIGSSAEPRSALTPTSPDKAKMMLPPPVPQHRLRPHSPSASKMGTTDDRLSAKSPFSRLRSRSMSTLSSSPSPSVRPSKSGLSQSISGPSKLGGRNEHSPGKSDSMTDLTLKEVAMAMNDEGGFEWGMDEDVGEEHDHGRVWREGSVVKFV